MNADLAYLRAKLHILKGACESCAQKTAKEIIAELRAIKWSPAVNSALGMMSEHLLNGDFEELMSLAENIIDEIAEWFE